MEISSNNYVDQYSFKHRYTRFFSSNLWYVVVLILTILIYIFPSDNLYISNVVLLAFSLCIAIGRMLIPVFFEPSSWVNKGWLSVAIAWGLIIVANIKDVLFGKQYLWFNNIIWYAAYLPYIVFITGSLVRFKFYQRSRESLVIDTLIMYFNINIISYILLKQIIHDIKFEDLFFFSINFSIIYSIYLIFIQKYHNFTHSFRYLSLCLFLFALVDLLWAVKEGLGITLYTAPLYGFAYMMYAKAPMILIGDPVPDDRQLLLNSGFQQIFPYIVIISGLIISVITQNFSFILSLLLLLAFKALVQARENVTLMKALDEARQEEIQGRQTVEAARRLEYEAREFVSFYHHEVDSLFKTLAYALRQLRRDERDTAAELWDMVDDATSEINHLLNKMEELAKEGRMAPLRLELLDSPSLVQQAIVNVQVVYPSVRFDTEIVLPTILGDRTFLLRAIETGIRNAAQAVDGQESAFVLISIFPEAGQFVLRIEDNGLGFAPHILVHVQDSLAALAKLPLGISTKEDGSGRGLPLMQRVALLHGGTLALGNGEGGAWVEIRFPAR